MEEDIFLNESDTKQLRKELGLPLTKKIKYLHKVNNVWQEENIVNYSVVDTYQPSGTKSLSIMLDSGKTIRILADYLADMQKTNFVSEMESEDVKTVSKKISKSNKSDKIKKEPAANTAPGTYTVVDLETTGVNHNKDEIIEIGAIKYVNGTETERFSMLVRTDKKISKRIEQLTGITNEMIEKEGVDKAIAIMSFYTFLGKDTVVGHNIASFDSKFLDDAFKQVLGCDFSNKCIDTLFIARKTCKELAHHRLEDLAEKYNVDYSKAHRAVEDCIINHLVYEYMVFDKLLDPNTSKEYLITNEISTDNLEEIKSEVLQEQQDNTYNETTNSQRVASFACCARYELCSDAKKCVHIDRAYSNGCEYRKNLEAGKIFYGKNKNID